MAKHETSKKGTHKQSLEQEVAPDKMTGHLADPTDTPGLEPSGEMAVDESAAAASGTLPSDAVSPDDTDTAAFGEELGALKELLAKKDAEAKEHYDRLTYLAAEFDNYRRRTQKEKERLFTDAIVEVTSAFLPVLDNLERATKAALAAETPEAVSLRDGVNMVERQFIETLSKLGVTEIAAQGAPFDPNLHNAVMHVEDEAFGANEVADVFQKGYRYKDETVVRHAMVKVAN